MGAFINLPIITYRTLKGWWIHITTFCKLSWLYQFVDYIAVTIPVCTIICISLDRYWLLSKKLNYPKYATKTKATIFLVFMWASSFTFHGIVSFAWLPFTGFEAEVVYWNCELEAMYNFKFQLFMIAFFFILPLSFLNIIVYLNIYKRAKGFVQSKPAPSQPKQQVNIPLLSRLQHSLKMRVNQFSLEEFHQHMVLVYAENFFVNSRYLWPPESKSE